MPTREITTKKFSSETTNATPSSDDRILFSDTSDGGAPKDARVSDLSDVLIDKTTNQTKTSSLAITTNDGLKTLQVINTGGGVGTEPALLVRMQASNSGRDIARFQNASGTNIVVINDAGHLIVNSQNRTTTTSYTPLFTGDSGSGATATINIAKYREFGDMAYVTLRCFITSKGTCSGVFYVSAPTTTSNTSCALAGGVYAIGTGPNSSKGRAGVATGSKFNFTKASQIANTLRSDIAVNDEVLITGRYIK